jgi:hypothetical protein
MQGKWGLNSKKPVQTTPVEKTASIWKVRIKHPIDKITYG